MKVMYYKIILRTYLIYKMITNPSFSFRYAPFTGDENILVLSLLKKNGFTEQKHLRLNIPFNNTKTNIDYFIATGL